MGVQSPPIPYILGEGVNYLTLRVQFYVQSSCGRSLAVRVLDWWSWGTGSNPPGTFPNVHFEYVFLDLTKIWSSCRLCSLVVWNPDSPQIAALNLVLKSSNNGQNQKTTFSVKLTRIPWMFNKIFYFFKKYKWSPIFNLKKSFDPPFWS